jgi:hypothetical protein
VGDAVGVVGLCDCGDRSWSGLREGVSESFSGPSLTREHALSSGRDDAGTRQVADTF